MKNFVRTLAFVSAAAFATPVFALTAQQTVQKEVVVKNADGSEQVRYEDASLVTPGERIVYTLNFNNDQVEPASNLVLTMPIPGEITYLEGTAENDQSVVTYSADGGQTFTTRDSVMVADGFGSQRAASTEELTHIRWNIAGPIAPGESGALVYKGLLK